MEYESIDELDGDLIAECKINSGSNVTNFNILYSISDWGKPSEQGTINIPINEHFNLKNKLLNSGHDYANRKQLYICIVQYKPGGISESYDYDFRIGFSSNKNIIRATSLSNNLIKELKNDFVSTGNYITCWGDSLTAGGGWTNTLENNLKVPVYNGGTGGENSATIMARQGGDIMTVNNITIPATKTPVIISSRSTDGGIMTELGSKVTPLLQSGAHINPCFIGDVEGTLAWTGSNYADMNGTWTFTRNVEGEEVLINRPTAIRTNFDMNRNDPKLMIIFMGQNGGYNNDVNELIRQHRLMIDHANTKEYIILGLSSGSGDERKEYEESMKKEFGRRFISLRQYLSVYGLDDAGIEPTEEDTTMMNEGKTPKSLLTDAVHYNEACKTVIGNMLSRKVRELNIF